MRKMFAKTLRKGSALLTTMQAVGGVLVILFCVIAMLMVTAFLIKHSCAAILMMFLLIVVAFIRFLVDRLMYDRTARGTILTKSDGSREVSETRTVRNKLTGSLKTVTIKY